MATTMAASHTPLKQLLSTLGPQDSSQGQNKVPRALARGPFWARLPPVRPRDPSSQTNESQNTSATGAGATAGTHGVSSSVPPIVAPDRIGTTRVLLQDTQACVQKFAARMDKLGAAVEQGVKDVQLCRTAMEGTGDKIIADVADVVFKSQTILSKEIEDQRSLLDKSIESVSHLISANESLTRLYDTQSASLQSLTQMYTNQQVTLQTIQEQQYRIIQTLSPLEPLIKGIPLQLEANQSNSADKMVDAMKFEIRRAVGETLEKMDLESVVLRLVSGLNARLPGLAQATPPEVDSVLPSNTSGSEPDHLPENSRKRKRSDDENAVHSRKNKSPIPKPVQADSVVLDDARAALTASTTSYLRPLNRSSSNADSANLCRSSPNLLVLPSNKEEQPHVSLNNVDQLYDDDTDLMPPKKLTQTRLNFATQKSILRKPGRGSLRRAETTLKVPNLHRDESHSITALTGLPQDTSSSATSSSGNAVLKQDGPGLESTSTEFASSYLTSKPSSSAAAPSNSTSARKAALKSKATKSRPAKPKPTGKRKEKKRATPPGVVQDQNRITPSTAKEKEEPKARAKSASPTRLNATSSNEISVLSEHDPPNSPKQLKLLSLLSDTKAPRLDSDEQKRKPFATLHLGQGPSQQSARLSTPSPGRQEPSSSTLIDLLGGSSTPDWNMAGAALAMTKAEQDLDPLSAMTTSDGFQMTGDPMSSVIQVGSRQRRYLVLESDSPGVDLWFDDLLDV